MTTLGQAALTAVAILFMLSAPAFLSEHQIHILIQIFFFAYLSSCWNILGGFTGQLSFGHALFLAVGAYTSTLLLLQLGVSPWIGMLAGGTLAGALGLLIGYLSFRYGIKGTFLF
jgi:branched-chain amino acid transport system permease protein